MVELSDEQKDFTLLETQRLYPYIHDSDYQIALKSLELTNEASTLGVRGGFLINGAASIALMTLLSALIQVTDDVDKLKLISTTTELKDFASAVAVALLCTACGTLLAGIAQYCRYQSRLAFHKSEQFLYPVGVDRIEIDKLPWIIRGNKWVSAQNSFVALSGAAVAIAIYIIAFTAIGIVGWPSLIDC